MLRGWRELCGAGVPGCPLGEAAGAAVITGGHTRREGPLKTNQLCVQGIRHANASHVIDFTCQPVPTPP